MISSKRVLFDDVYGFSNEVISRDVFFPLSLEFPR